MKMHIHKKKIQYLTNVQNKTISLLFSKGSKQTKPLLITVYSQLMLLYQILKCILQCTTMQNNQCKDVALPFAHTKAHSARV